MMSRSSILAFALALALLGAAQNAGPAGDPARGRTAFFAHGCEECHGTLGQGNPRDGVRIAPHPVPYEAFLAQLRKPRSAMPPYDAKILGERDAADIYAFLASIPAGKPATAIPILAAVGTGNAGPPPKVAAGVAHGRAVYTQNCASCHGADGAGGFGPALTRERSRKDLRAAVSFIENPVAPMPKLYPSRLSERDVADVAAYVESL
ncbi:MAG TPA: c-type cytochrome [Candidatus Limnocylindria bacterium]|jgi:mono/diheme cytochrome c family protein|nr:c-type cytochrome [Candidatus Limnocylindria bacterium]